MRPGDAEETAGAYIHGMNRKGGPTAYILSRQDLPVLTEMSAADKRAGTMKGAYTIVKETAELTNVILAAGSELHVAVEGGQGDRRRLPRRLHAVHGALRGAGRRVQGGGPP